MKDEIILGNELIECEKEIKKSRLLIIKNNEILIANYAGVYLLPGGKLEPNENYDMALYREVKEEVGMSICDNYYLSDIKPLVNVNYYQENFPSRNEKFENRLVKTRYYYLYVDNSFEIKGNSLSDSEKENNFYLKFVNIDEIDDVINSNKSLNPRKVYFDNELLAVIDYFKKNFYCEKTYKKIKENF